MYLFYCVLLALACLVCGGVPVSRLLGIPTAHFTLVACVRTDGYLVLAGRLARHGERLLCLLLVLRARPRLHLQRVNARHLHFQHVVHAALAFQQRLACSTSHRHEPHILVHITHMQNNAPSKPSCTTMRLNLLPQPSERSSASTWIAPSSYARA